MNRPMVALLVAPGPMQGAVERGEKRVTIRQGHRDYTRGDRLVLCCDITQWAVRARVVGVEHTTLAEVSDEVVRADGFSDRWHALRELRRFYPSLVIDSPVTVVHWELESR